MSEANEPAEHAEAPSVTRKGRQTYIDGVEYVKLSTMQDRLAKSKSSSDGVRAQLEVMQGRVSAAEARAASFEEKASGYDSLRAEFGEYRSGIERAGAFRAAGIDPDSDDTSAVRDRIRRIYSADMAALPDDAERVSFGDWLPAQRTDPVLSHLFSSGAPAAPAAPAGRTPQVQRGNPAQPAPQTELTQAQIMAQHRAMLAEAGGDIDKLKAARDWLNSQKASRR